MKNLNVKPFAYLFLGISSVLWIGIAYISKVDFSDVLEFVFVLPKVVSIDLLLITVFVKWGWRLKFFKSWLVPFPNLNGTWEGTIRSTWEDPNTGKQPGPIPTVITIKQTFTKLSCVMHTKEMKSYSFTEAFRLEDDNQIRQLVFSYLSKPLPSVSYRSTAHEGTVILNIIGNPVYKLEGYYWTNRKTTGEISLTFRERTLVDEIPREYNTHPVSSIKI